MSTKSYKDRINEACGKLGGINEAYYILREAINESNIDQSEYFLYQNFNEVQNLHDSVVTNTEQEYIVRLRYQTSYQITFDVDGILSFCDYSWRDKLRSITCYLDDMKESEFNFNMMFPEFPLSFQDIVSISNLSKEIGRDLRFSIQKKE